MTIDFNNFINEIEKEIDNSKVDQCLDLFINKIVNNKEVITNEKQIREVCYTFLGKDKIFGSISKINEELLKKSTTEDKNQLWIIYYLIYYSGQLYPYLFTYLLYNNILEKITFDINNIPINKNELFYQSTLRVCYKIGHLHKLSNRDLELFNEQIITTLLEFIEHTRNYHDETVNYSIIEFLMVLNYQIQHKIDNKDKKINNTIKVNNILTVLKTRINHSKTLSENLIFILNRTNDYSVKYYLLKFLSLVFSSSSLDNFFYTNDIPVLLDVTLRELWNLTDEHIHIQKGYLRLLEKLIQYTINNNIPYRYHDITKLLFVVSKRSQNTCYSNKTQHAKLEILSNLAQRILNKFNSILDVTTLTPLTPSYSHDSLVSLNHQAATPSKSSKSKSSKKSSKKGKSSLKSAASIDDSAPISKTGKEEKIKVVMKRRSNPLNKTNKESDVDTESPNKNVEIESPSSKNEVEEEENEHERLSQRARDIFMKSYLQYQESNNDTSSVHTNEEYEQDPIQEHEIIKSPDENENNEEKEEEEESKDHEKLSQRAMNIFLKSYQQYQESNNDTSSIHTDPISFNEDSIQEHEIIQSPNESENKEEEEEEEEEDRDHEKLSQRARDIFMKSYQQYQESNSETSTPNGSITIHDSNTNSNSNPNLTMTTVQEKEPPMSPENQDKDHDKLSERAMNIFIKSLQQYNNEQDAIQSATLPSTYIEKHKQQYNQLQPQEAVYSANSYFPRDNSNHSQSTYYTNSNTTNFANTTAHFHVDNDNSSLSSNSTVSNSNSLPIPSRLDSLNSKYSNIIDPIERHQSPFSDCYQIPSQYQNHIYNNNSVVASPALSAASYNSNYSASSTTKPPFYQSKPNNIFKKENKSNMKDYSPYLPGASTSTSTRVNPINNIFDMEANIINDDPIERQQSPFDNALRIE